MFKPVKNIIWKIKMKQAKKEKNHEAISELLRKKGVNIGDNCALSSYTFALGEEPYLITIGDNTVFSSNVSLITHDASCCAIKNIRNAAVFGKITIGKNCFIGMNSTILYGVTLGDNVIVAAGSVVTKSVESGNVVAGVPARVICKTEEYIKKIDNNILANNQFEKISKKQLLLETDKLIVR